MIAKAIVLSYVAVFSSMAFAAEGNHELAKPPEVSAEWIALADAEDLEKRHTVLASAYFSKEEKEEKTDELYAQLLFTYHASGSEGKRSLFGQQLYLEKGIPGTDDLSVWGVAFHDQEFRSAYAGLAKKIGNWSVALGVGSAWYDGVRHTAINPWAYYVADGLEVFLTAEHYYSREEANSWYYKGYLTKKLSESFFAGIYGEKDVGIGPMIGWQWNERIKFSLAIPLMHRPSIDSEAGRTKAIASVSIEF